jgi:dihydrolipoamide dehydrogenase
MTSQFGAGQEPSDIEKMKKKYDAVVLGGGPGGYVAAIRGRQLGLGVALVDKDELGGVCLNWGCIPTKSLLRNAEVISLLKQGKTFGFRFDERSLKVDYGMAQKRSRQVSERLSKGVESLMKKHGVDVYCGTGTLKTQSQLEIKPTGEVLETRNIVIATGSRPHVPPGLRTDGKRILNWRHALELTSLPEKMVIVGAGAIGMEFAHLWQCFGVDITVVEMLPSVLPWADPDVSIELKKRFERRGIRVMTETRVEEVHADPKGVVLTLSNRGKTDKTAGDKVLIAIGIKPNSEDLGLEKLGVKTEKGFVQVDETMKTSIPGIYAIGDVTGKLPLAHVASAQGMTAMAAIAGRNADPLNYQNMPRCCYCHPEVASIGLTEQEAREKGYNIRVGTYPFLGNGKALGLSDTHGFVKIIASTEDDEILGTHLVGPSVTEIVGGITGMTALEATVEELAGTIFPHPSLSEAIKEAAHSARGEPIHL